LDEHVVGCAGAEDNSAGGPTCASISIGDLLSKIDGKRIPTASGTVLLATKSTKDRPVLVRFHDLGPGRRVLHAVAAPVFDASGACVAAVSVAGPAYRLTADRLEDLGRRCIAASEAILPWKRAA
jgi:hypothetical protein